METRKSKCRVQYGLMGKEKDMNLWRDLRLLFFAFTAFVLYSLLAAPHGMCAFDLTVTGSDGVPVTSYKWLVEEDNTNLTVPGALVSDSISVDIHKSHAPVFAQGEANTQTITVNVPSDRRYVVSVLPGAGYSLSGANVAVGQADVTVVVQKEPIKTAQISIFAFMDHNIINNVFDDGDTPLGGCSVILFDAGGQVLYDAFGNYLGTTYLTDIDGEYVLDLDGNPIPLVLGNGQIKTLTQEEFDNNINPLDLRVGEALIKNLVPGKYGVRVIPPHSDDDGNEMKWVQTSTIEGTPTVDAWVKANEPRLFVEGFGTGFYHVFFGFVKISPNHSTFKGQALDVVPWNAASPGGTAKITGTLRVNHFSRPPNLQGFFAGEPVKEGWIGLNYKVPGQTTAGLYAAPCNPDTGEFEINNVPAGTYMLVWWDTPLDNLFGFRTVTVAEGETLNLGNVLVFQWFGQLHGKVFYDADEDGFPDDNETGIPDQVVNIRFRDGTVYQSTATDTTGSYSFKEVFPFFKWLVTEVDFARLKATGMTSVVDYGGEVLPDQGWDWPSRDKLHPQPQAEDNPNTGNNLSRTETGPVLTQAMHLFLGQYNEINWGKKEYMPGENGGISGIVFYDTTRAEDDPRYNAGEPWQPGIPRVQVNLYRDADRDGVIDDINGEQGIQLADVDNHPFENFPGPEDVDWNGNGVFDLGDALQFVTSDSWDDNPPSGCIQDLPVIHGQPIKECADAFGTWNQVRPAVFDGGYAFADVSTGTYIVEVTTPRTQSGDPAYKVVKSQDKNVDFGDTFTPSPLALPPVCVGDPYVVPDELSLFPGLPAPLAGQTLNHCDRKQVDVLDKKNTAADFFLFTDVPKAARAVGFVNNDLGAEFNMGSPNYGEKLAAPWIPISFRDWTGRELLRVYSDEFGGYNAMLPSTFTMNVPAPSGVSPNMLTLVLNDPIRPDGSVDPYYNPKFSVTPWTFNYMPGTTSYLDTPLVPVIAFGAHGQTIDTEAPDKTPAICSVDGPEPEVGPLVCTDRPNGRQIVIRSVGVKDVLNPDYDPNVPGSTFMVSRDYGFGTTPGEVTLDGVSLVIDSWSDSEILATVPDGHSSGRLMVKRGDNSKITELGVTLLIIDCSSLVVWEVPGDFPTIQDAIDNPGTNAGDLILVAPGSYTENVIMYKPVRIQGSGAGCTTVNANPTPLEKVDAWHTKVNELGGGELPGNPLAANEAPGFLVMGETDYGIGILDPGYPFNVPGQAAIDGFTILGSKMGGGIYAVSGAHGLMITNNSLTNNQGNFAGGISVGVSDTGIAAISNNDVVIMYNKIHRNGGVQGGGGISIFDHTNDYTIQENIIHGNFSRFNGGGINHSGLCGGQNLIYDNRIIFNENFFGFQLNNAGEGGGIYIGGLVAGGAGTGNVDIIGNLIQGNMTGSGNGGGINLFAVNGQDIADNPSDPDAWYKIRIINNMIVNNIAGKAGGGIFLHDVVNCEMVNNTIANNDSTATSSLAFEAGASNSTPQGAGVVSRPYSTALQTTAPVLSGGFSTPALINNIIWHNRSWYDNASLNGGAGGLAPNPAGLYWDLLVEGSTAATDPHLNPVKCILSSRIDPGTGFDYGAEPLNYYSDPRLKIGYHNDLEIATVIDEGGNSISLRFSPIYPNGDYHIIKSSPAVNAGLIDAVVPVDDFDKEARSQPDIGADEWVFGPKTIADVVIDYYWAALGRAQDQGGLDYWRSEIERIFALGIDIKEGFIGLAQFFFHSPEYQARGRSDADYLRDLYLTFMNRVPDQWEVDYWLGQISLGLSRDSIMLSFCYSDEFRLYMESLFGAYTTRAEYNMVNDFYRGLLSRLPDNGGFAFWLAQMQAAQCAAQPSIAVKAVSAQIAYSFFLSQEYQSRNRNNGEFVDDLYNAILRRGADASGRAYWIGVLDQNSLTRSQVLGLFIESPEFQGRVEAVAAQGCL
jgi:hypothetical protein